MFRTISSFLLASAAVLIPAPLLAQAVVQPLNGDADALATAMRRVGANANDVDALVTAGELSLKLGDVSGAASLFARAGKVDPMNGRVKAGMARILVTQERPGEALRYFDQAVGYGLDPRSFAADRGLAYDLIGEQRRAQADYRLALGQQRDAEVVRRYALSLGIAGRKEQALEEIDTLIRAQDRGAWRARAFILAMNGDQEGAAKIATTMLPGMAGGLAPFFARLPALSPTDRAFAVHFGEVRATPQRVADARLAPALAPLPPEEPVRVAAAPVRVETPAADDRRSRRSRDTRRTAPAVATRAPVEATAPARAPVTVAAATTPAAPPHSTGAAPYGTIAQTMRDARGLGPSYRFATPATSTPRPPVTASVPAAVTPAPVVASAPATLTPAPVTTPTPPPVMAQTPSALSTPPAAITPTPMVQPLPARAPAQVASAPLVRAPVRTAPRTVTAPGGAIAPQLSDNAILARIIANIKVPDAELAAPGRRAAIARKSTAEEPAKPLTPAERRLAARKADAAPADKPQTAAERRLAARKAAAEEEKPQTAAERRLAARKAAEKKAADAKAAAEQKAAKADPERIWVQVAGGANEGDLGKAWKATQGKARSLAGRSAYTTPLRATNRVVTGPFKTDAEARAFVNKLRAEGVSAFTFTSDAGQKMTKLGK